MAFETLAGPLKCRPFYYPMLLGQYDAEIQTANAYLSHSFTGAQTAQALAVERGNINFIAIAKQLAVGGKAYVYFTFDNTVYIMAERKNDGRVYLTYKSPNVNNKALANQVIETSYGSYLCLGFAVDEDTERAAIFKFSFTYDRATLDHGVGSLSGCTVGSDAAALAIQTDLYTVLKNAEIKPDPYIAGGVSTTGGGGGNFDDTSDTISLPSAPALNLSLNHFLSAYVPTVTQLNDLADYIWGNYDKTDSNKVLSKILANPQDAIIGLFMLPFTPGSSTAIEVTIGSYGTSVNMPPLTAQFADVDCGSLTIEEYWGNYLDYNPYTRITLFLPGVGEVQLDPDEVMGQTIGVLYRVDCLTGNFVCFVSGDNKIFAQYQGNCALQVPVSAADYSRLNQAMLQAALGAVGAVAGVATAGGAVAAAMEGAEAAAGGASTALNIMNSKVNHSHSGTLSGSGFFMGSQKPYVIIHRARQSVPEDANEFYGYPSNIKATLGAQYGFTSVSSIILDGVPLTDPELDELRGILKGGIIIS